MLPVDFQIPAGLILLAPLVGAGPEGPRLPSYSDHANLLVVKTHDVEDRPARPTNV
jgi:hypothetical protein